MSNTAFTISFIASDDEEDEEYEYNPQDWLCTSCGKESNVLHCCPDGSNICLKCQSELGM